MGPHVSLDRFRDRHTLKKREAISLDIGLNSMGDV